MVNLIYLYQAYKWHKITEVKWINSKNNPADAITKVKLCQALRTLINTNKLNLEVTEWVEQN